MIKFRTLHNLARVIDTSAIFTAATDGEASSFTNTYSNLFAIVNFNYFVAGTSRNVREYMTSLARRKVLQNHTAQTLREALAVTNLAIEVRNEKVVMPSNSSTSALLGSKTSRLSARFLFRPGTATSVLMSPYSSARSKGTA